MKKIKVLLKRMESPVFWVEAILIIAQIGKITGMYEIDNTTVSLIQDFITTAFTLFATLNNPTTKDKF